MNDENEQSLQQHIEDFYRRMEERKEVSHILIKLLATHRIVQDLRTMRRPVQAAPTLVERVCKQVVRVLYPQRERPETRGRAPGKGVMTDVIYVVSESGGVEEAADEAIKKEKNDG